MGRENDAEGRREHHRKPREERDPFQLVSLLSQKVKAAQKAVRLEREELNRSMEPNIHARRALRKVEFTR